MNVVVTIEGKDYVLSLREAQNLCRDIHNQLYPPTKK